MSRAYHMYVLAEGLSRQSVIDVKFLFRFKEKDSSAREINNKPMEDTQANQWKTLRFEIREDIKVTMKMRMPIKQEEK